MGTCSGDRSPKEGADVPIRTTELIGGIAQPWIGRRAAAWAALSREAIESASARPLTDCVALEYLQAEKGVGVVSVCVQSRVPERMSGLTSWAGRAAIHD